MRYEEPICRPGMCELDSYLLQVTIGCAHNKCTFCSFYKKKPFRIRPFTEIKEDLQLARLHYSFDPPVFLIDGNATCYSMDRLRPILQEIQKVFPNSPHTNMYARFSDIYSHYSVTDLKEMRSLNVRFLYMGMESGSDVVLANVKKGVTQNMIIDSSQRISEAGISFNSSVIFGLGGKINSEEHIKESIKVINQIKPNAVSTTVLCPQKGTPLYNDIIQETFELPTYRDVLREEYMLLDGLVFTQPTLIWTGRFLPGDSVIRAEFPKDKKKVLSAVLNRPVVNTMLDQTIKIED